MTDKEKKYAQEGICPCCGSDDIDYGVFELDMPTGGYFECNCNECGANFDEWYDVTFNSQWNITADKVGEDIEKLDGDWLGDSIKVVETLEQMGVADEVIGGLAEAQSKVREAKEGN